MRFCERIIVAMNTSQWAFFDEILLAVVYIETSCCESMLITCFTSCFEMWDVIWEMRFRFVLRRNCLSDLFSWSCLIILSSVFSDRLALFLANNACSFLIIKWRMSDETFSLMKNLIKVRRLIKSDESGSSNLTKATHQTRREKTSFHQTWGRHLIKFLRRKTVHLLSDKQSFAATLDVKNLVLRRVIFNVRCLCEIAMIN
jgi:hypothetical protein